MSRVLRAGTALTMIENIGLDFPRDSKLDLSRYPQRTTKTATWLRHGVAIHPTSLCGRRANNITKGKGGDNWGILPGPCEGSDLLIISRKFLCFVTRSDLKEYMMVMT